MAKEAKPKGEWLPCGCRKDTSTGKFVRICPEHQPKPKE